jgi:hypothetical protein
MKFAPPGAEAHVIMNRLDGFVGTDPDHIPNRIAARIITQSYGCTEIDRIKGRMLARLLTLERKKMVTIALRKRFGLLTRYRDHLSDDRWSLAEVTSSAIQVVPEE